MKRNTLAKQIRSQTDTYKAREVAQYGRELSPIERAAARYLTWRDGFDDVATKCKSDLVEIIFRAVDTAAPVQRQLTPAERAAFGYGKPADDLAKATFKIEQSNAIKAIHELAEFIGNFSRLSNPHNPADKERARILLWKDIAEDMGEAFPEMTVAGLAENLQIKKTEDGNKALRKKCQELGFSPAKSDKVNKFKKKS
jgi:hypothetical protein